MLTGKKIGIVGLGLIGGSIEKRLKQKKSEFQLAEILCVSQSQNRLDNILDLADCDLIFLCNGQESVKADLTQIAKYMAQAADKSDIPFKNTLITDIASTKSQICKHAEELGLKNFIGGHPMAGTEKQGYDNSFPELFQDCKWALTKTNDTLSFLIKEVLSAGEVIYLDPIKHDEAVACISHLPLVLSYGLADLLKQNPVAAKLIGPGFKSMTRLAKGNLDLADEIINQNKHNIASMWEDYAAEVAAVLKMPKDQRQEAYKELKALTTDVC
jgi:prephenate dehydrogenase